MRIRGEGGLERGVLAVFATGGRARGRLRDISRFGGSGFGSSVYMIYGFRALKQAKPPGSFNNIL